MNARMRVVFLVRVPRWYSFRGDRLTRLMEQRGHEVAGIIVETAPARKYLDDKIRKLGASMLLRKISRICLRWVRPESGTGGETQHTSVAPPVYTVKSHNSDKCAELLRSLEPDIVVLRGCGIIRNKILQIPKIGVLNAHYGELPKYRGVYVTEWAVLHGDRPMITVFLVNEGVDAGDIIATRPVPMQPGATLASLRDESSRIGGELLADTVDDFAHGRVRRTKQSLNAGLQYYSMHPRISAVAERKLRRLVQA